MCRIPRTPNPSNAHPHSCLHLNSYPPRPYPALPAGYIGYVWIGLLFYKSRDILCFFHEKMTKISLFFRLRSLPIPHVGNPKMLFSYFIVETWFFRKKQNKIKKNWVKYPVVKLKKTKSANAHTKMAYLSFKKIKNKKKHFS